VVRMKGFGAFVPATDFVLGSRYHSRRHKIAGTSVGHPPTLMRPFIHRFINGLD